MNLVHVPRHAAYGDHAGQVATVEGHFVDNGRKVLRVRCVDGHVTEVYADVVAS